MFRTYVLATVLLTLPVTTTARAAAIVDKGTVRAEIVVADVPVRMTTLAAKELQGSLAKMTGGTLPIVTERTPGRVAIFVGTSRHTAALGLATEGLAHGAFRMESGPEWLALVGPEKDFVPIEPWGRSRSAGETARVNAAWDAITGDTFWNPARDLHFRYHADLDVWDQDDAGTFNAVQEFLRGLGCRWFAPGELGEVIPRRDTIPLPDVHRTVTPAFPVRRFVYYTEHTGIGEKALWNLRLGLNHGTQLVGFPQICHGIKFVIKREEMKRSHPGMYLVRGGRPDTTFKEVASGYDALAIEHLNLYVAVHRGENRWSIELRLPIVGEDAFTLDPEKGIAGASPKELFPWHFNLVRARVRNGTVERTAYSPTGAGDVRDPAKFAKLWTR